MTTEVESNKVGDLRVNSVKNTNAADVLREVESLRARVVELEAARVVWTESEAAHCESEQRLRTLFNYAPEAVTMLDVETVRFIDVNPKAEELFGLSRSELCQLGPFDLSPSFQPDGRPSREQGLERIKEVLAGGTPVFEWWHRNARGHLFPCEVRLVRIPWGDRSIIRGSITEISERKTFDLLERGRSQILERVARDESLASILQNLVETIEELLPGMICSVLILDRATNRLRHGAGPSLPRFYNDAVDGLQIGPNVGSCGAAAYKARRVIVSDVMAHPNWSRYRELAKQAGLRACWSEPVLSLSGKVLGTFAMYYRQPRRPTPLELRAIEVAGQLAGIAMQHDETQKTLIDLNASLERRVAERTVQLSLAIKSLEQNNDELRQFAHITSHDLQEPLRMVTSFGQLLQREYAGRLDATADEWLHFIVDGGQRMQELIQDLLEYSHIESRARPFRPVKLEHVLKHALSSLRSSIEDSGAQITQDKLPAVLGDERQLIQLFQNLISNAVKFHGQSPPRIHLSVKKDGAHWLVSVQDNGIGIAPQYLDHIFDLFKRLHGRQRIPGTGIGLAICKRVVERHNGQIWVDSKPDLGSSFFFTLPDGGPH